MDLGEWCIGLSSCLSLLWAAEEMIAQLRGNRSWAGDGE
jgi:hypothetical protein